MTRETKIGLIVAGSFLCLVGIVVASKWRGGDGADSEEQTVVPGAVLHPTQNPGDAKATGKGEPTPAPVAAAQPKGHEKKNEHPSGDAQPKGLPGLGIPPAVAPIPTPTEENAIEAELERRRQEELEQKRAEEIRAAMARNADPAAPGGVGAPLPMPTPREAGTPPVGGYPPLPTPGGAGAPPVGGYPPLPTPGGAGAPPVGGYPPLPTPGGAGAPPVGGYPPLPTPGEAGAPPVGGYPPLPTPGGAGAPPVGGMPPMPTPGGAGTLPPSPFAKDGANKPAPAGGVELPPVKPFNDPTPIPDPPKPAPFDPAGGVIPPQPLDPMLARKGPTFGPLAPLPDPVKPPVTPTPGDPSWSLPPIKEIKPASGEVAVIPPTGGAVLPAAPIIVGGAARPVPAVNDVNIDIYECQKGDSTFQILSLRMYGSDKYADALLQYNRDHSAIVKNGSTFSFNRPVLNPGQQVLKPPPTVLDRDYANLVRTAPPQVRVDAPMPLTPTPGPIPRVSSPPARGPGGTYTVQNPAGESILDIAERVLGDRSQWHKIFRVNPNYPPQNLIPAGTTLTLPSD